MDDYLDDEDLDPILDEVSEDDPDIDNYNDIEQEVLDQVDEDYEEDNNDDIDDDQEPEEYDENENEDEENYENDNQEQEEYENEETQEVEDYENDNQDIKTYDNSPVIEEMDNTNIENDYVPEEPQDYRGMEDEKVLQQVIYPDGTVGVVEKTENPAPPDDNKRTIEEIEKEKAFLQELKAELNEVQHEDVNNYDNSNGFKM